MKTATQIIIAAFLTVITALPVHGDGNHPAGIKLDGTLGSAGKLDLPGPNYDIRAEYGQQAGANLFHSFQRFNVHSYESATFSGPDSVRNIISRITAGNASWIDGRLGSTIPDADLYMLNPSGVMFGPNASLDLGGSFHVSTADYLKMGENGKFFSQPSENETLSVASPAAFGFLDDHVAPVSLEGGEIAAPGESEYPGLRVSPGNTVSIVGGDITVNSGLSYQRPKTGENGEPVFETAVDENGDPVTDDDGNPVLATDENGNQIQVIETVEPANIHAEYGRINMAAVASPGEVAADFSDMHVTPAEKMGDVTLSDRARIDVSGEGAGSIFIRSGQFSADESSVQAGTLGGRDGGRVDIQVESLSFTNGSAINCKTVGKGKGADIDIRSGSSVSFTGTSDERSFIQLASGSEQEGAGDAGKLLIEAEDISFTDSYINANTFGKGRGGEVTLKAGSVTFAGEITYNASIDVATIYDQKGAGDAGKLLIEADDISFTGGAYILASTFGKGTAGEVTLKADSISFTGEKSDEWGSAIELLAWYQQEGAGDAGKLLIEARDISFVNGAYINTSTRGKGRAGEVTLKADSVTFAGEASDGRGSRIALVTVCEQEGGGDAGKLLIEARDISFADGAYISSTTFGKGGGGEITLKADSVSFAGEASGGEKSGIFIGTMFEKEGGGDAGKLLIEARDISFADGAGIAAMTSGSGDAGDITLRADKTISLTGSDSEGNGSRIYAGSEGTAEDSGSGGDMIISARTLSIADKGEISTSSAGGGKSGDIRLSIKELRMNTGSSLSSESSAANSYAFDSISGRDCGVLIAGDVVKVADAGDGRSESYVRAGETVRLTPVYAVQNLTELNELADQHAVSQGDMAEVADTGEGKPGRYIYAYESAYNLSEWVRIGSSDSAVTVPEMSEVAFDNMWIHGEENLPPYASGDMIRVEDAGNGKPGIFIYSTLGNGGFFWVQAIRLTRFDVADSTELNGLTENISLKNGDVARFADPGDGTPSEFLFYNGEWITFNNVHTVADIAEMDSLITVYKGNTAIVTDSGNGDPATFVYSGRDWAVLNDVHTVPDMAARDALTATGGDVAKVTDSGSGRPGYFLYSGGNWISFAKGDAGTIEISAGTVRMTDGSSVTSSAGGHGNASDIILETEHLEADSGSVISSESESGLFGGEAGRIVIAGEVNVEKNEAGEIVRAEPVRPANILRLNGDSRITTDGISSGGGTITVDVRDSLHLSESEITTSVSQGEGGGGDIKIGNTGAGTGPRFVIMDQSRIKADADGGDGGAVFITAENFVKSSDAAVTASSNRGNEGRIEIAAPDTDISGDLTVLPGTLLDAARWMETPCEARNGEKMSRFLIKGRDAAPTSPNDLSPARAFRKGVPGRQGFRQGKT